MTNLSNINRLALLKTALDRAHAATLTAESNLMHAYYQGQLRDAFNEYQAFHAICFDEQCRRREDLVEAVSFKPELLVGDSWLANLYRFASAFEAISCARSLLEGWQSHAQNARATGSRDAPTHTWSEGRIAKI
jgi:hypothetical protein